MARKEVLREELDDRKLPSDRRVSQVRGEIDVSDLDAEDLAGLREEDITNLNENELDQLDTNIGVAQDTEERSDILPVKKLNRDVERMDEQRVEEITNEVDRSNAAARRRGK